MKPLCILSLMISACFVQAQVRISPQAIHFGTFTRDTEPVVDILVENLSGQRDFLLRHTFSHEYDVRISSSEMQPGGIIVIRIRFNPRKNGPFEDRIQLYFANSPTPLILPVTALVQYVNPNGDTACPDFSQRQPECCASNLFLVEVLDDDTGLPVPKALVRLEENGYLQLRLLTNNQGQVSQEARIAFFEISAEKSGYHPASLKSYINSRHNRFVLRLRRDPSFNPMTDGLYIPPDTTAEAEQAPELLPEDQYAANNVVFLLDISGSMSVGDKMDLMRKALGDLTEILRPMDQLTLVSYADEARVLMTTRSGADKDEILTVVKDLQAGGKTSGTKGFRRSYEILRKTFVPGGNNQLIVITDGAFNPEDQADIRKLVYRSASRQFRTSTVAIRGGAFASTKLSELAELGNGSFLSLDSLDIAGDLLIGELRKQSRK